MFSAGLMSCDRRKAGQEPPLAKCQLADRGLWPSAQLRRFSNPSCMMRCSVAAGRILTSAWLASFDAIELDKDLPRRFRPRLHLIAVLGDSR